MTINMERIAFILFVSIWPALLTAQELFPKTNGKGAWGFCDANGAWVIKPKAKYELVRSFSEGFAQVKANGLWGYINQSGKQVVPCRYKDCGPFHGGLAYACQNKSYGYIDTNGTMAIPASYAKARSFYHGLALVAMQRPDGQLVYGYIDSRGENVIPCRYSRAYDFSNGLACVFANGEGYFIDTAGQVWFGPFQEDPYSSLLSIEKDTALSWAFPAASWQDQRGSKVYISDKTVREAILKKKSQKRMMASRQRISKEMQDQSFSDFAQKYVEQNINRWQKKGEFEKIETYRNRVSDENRQLEIEKYLQEAKQAYITEKSGFHPLEMKLGSYDSENEVFLIQEEFFGDILVPVPIGQASYFKQHWPQADAKPAYTVADDRIALKSIRFLFPDSSVFLYDRSRELEHMEYEIDYHFDPIEIDMPAVSSSQPQPAKISKKHLSVSIGKSDIDVKIPETDVRRDQTFAIIIANENYMQLSPVPYAINDGEVFGKYCHKTLGIPLSNIRSYYDATYGTLLLAMKDLVDIANAYQGEIDVIFYYAGHGAPDENTKEAYIVPTDAYDADPAICYSINRLYQELGEIKARSITVFLDACFSGADRNGSMLASSRGIALKPQTNMPSGNTIVFSAASDNESAHSFDEKGHGLFTYFLLKKIQESKGNVNYLDLGNYIIENVKRQSVVINRRSQSPCIIPSPHLQFDWKQAKL